MYSKTSSGNSLSPKRWAMLVGVNYYQDANIPNLRYCVADTRALGDLLLAHSNYGYVPDRVRVLTSTNQQHDQATRLNILKELTELANSAITCDLLLFYFSGHGELVDGEPYLIPSDAKGDFLLADTAIPLRRIKEIMQSAVNVRAKVVILDACHSGIKLNFKSLDQGQKAFFSQVKSVFEGEGFAVLASSSQDEPSLEDAQKEHGAFTYYLLEGLKHAANENRDAYITLHEIFHYVTDKLRRNYPQKPTLDFQGAGEIVLLPVQASPIPTANPVRRVFPMAVKQTRDFYDRCNEMAQIKTVLETTTDILVIIKGDRCTGKTSLLNRVRNLLGEDDWQGRRFAHFSLEPHSAPTVHKFAHEIWHGLRKALQDAGLSSPAELDAPFSFDTFSGFAYRLERLNTQLPDVTFVAFVDEFDKFAYDKDVEYKQIIGLIHYIVEKTKFPLLFFITALQELPESYGSPVPLCKVTLHPFSPADTDKMVLGLHGDHGSPCHEILAKIYEYGGGYPHSTKLLVAHLWDQYKGDLTQWNPKTFEEAVRQAAKSPEAQDVFGDIYNGYLTDDERYILLWLATRPNFALAKENINQSAIGIRTASKQLLERDFLIELGNNYCLRIALMGEWFKQWTRFELELERLKVFKTPPTPTISQPQAIISAQGVCIDESTQQVYVEGQTVTVDLTDLQWRALLYLAQNRDRVVSYDDLANHLHPNELYDKTDQSMTSLIHDLRVVLKDLQKPRKYLETLHKRGVRLKNATLVRTIFGK